MTSFCAFFLYLLFYLNTDIVSKLMWLLYRPRVQHDYPTMVSMELQRTSTEDSEEDSSRVKTANTNRRLVPLTKGDNY